MHSVLNNNKHGTTYTKWISFENGFHRELNVLVLRRCLLAFSLFPRLLLRSNPKSSRVECIRQQQRFFKIGNPAIRVWRSQEEVIPKFPFAFKSFFILPNFADALIFSRSSTTRDAGKIEGRKTRLRSDCLMNCEMKKKCNKKIMKNLRIMVC